jgi:hypothetical protein
LQKCEIIELRLAQSDQAISVCIWSLNYLQKGEQITTLDCNHENRTSFFCQTKPFDQLEYISSALIIEKAHYLLCTLLSQASSAGEEASSPKPAVLRGERVHIYQAQIKMLLRRAYCAQPICCIYSLAHIHIHKTGAQRRSLPPHVNFVIIKEE